MLLQAFPGSAASLLPGVLYLAVLFYCRYCHTGNKHSIAFSLYGIDLFFAANTNAFVGRCVAV